MSGSTVHVHRLNILSTSVTLHVSRVSALPALWLMLSFCLLWRGTCQRKGLGQHLATTFVLQIYLSLVVRKGEFVISLEPLYTHINDTDRCDRRCCSYPTTKLVHTVLHLYLVHNTYKNLPPLLSSHYEQFCTWIWNSNFVSWF